MPNPLHPILVSHPIFHTPRHTGRHPLAIRRVGALIDLLRALDWLPPDQYVEGEAASRATLRKFHNDSYLDALIRANDPESDQTLLREKFKIGTLDNPIYPGLFERTSLLVGNAILAADLALQKRHVFFAAGGTHHGRPAHASGFCFTNDPVFALHHWLEKGLSRIAYIDFDAHHGDGVEDAFFDDPRILTISVHEQKRWPNTGLASSPTALNFPVPKGFDDDGFRALLKGSIYPALHRFKPEAVLVMSGADALAHDPLCGLSLSIPMVRNAILSVLDHAPIGVVLGGGGYNPWNAVRLWASLWAHLNDRPVPDRLPPEARAILSGLEAPRIPRERVPPEWIDRLDG